MHILLLTYEFHPVNGGVANASMALCQALRDHLHARISVAACVSWWPWEEPLRFERHEELDIHRIKYTGLPEERPFRQTIRSLLCLRELIPLVRRLRPDVILSQRVFDLGLAGALLGKWTSARTLTYAHGPDDVQHAQLKPLRKRLNRLAMRWNDVTLTTNSAYRAFLESCLPGTGVAVVPNIVECPAETVRSPRTEHRRFRIGCAGRMVVEHGVETKGFSFAIRAMALLPGCDLHLYGEGPHRETLEKLAAECRVQDRVTFHGKASREELQRAFRELDVFLHPAIFEGLPMVVLEAMCAGLPVIATASGGLPDLIRDGETGFVIREQDPGSIADAIVRAQNDPDLLVDVAEKGCRYIRSYASGKVVAEKFLSLMKASSAMKESGGPK